MTRSTLSYVVAVLLLGSIVLLPMLFLVKSSFMTSAVVFQELLTQLIPSYIYTIWVAVCATIISVVCGFSLASFFWLYKQHGVVDIIQCMFAIPYALVAFFVLVFFSSHGLLVRSITLIFGEQVQESMPDLIHNTTGLSIVLGYIWKQIPFSYMLYLSRFRRIGDRYLNAARVCGATVRKSILHVFAPMMTTTTIPLAIILFTYNYFGYEVGYIAGTSKPRLLSVHIMELFGSANREVKQSSFAAMLLVYGGALLVAGIAVILWQLCKRLDVRKR